MNDLYSETCNCAALPDLADNADEWDAIYTDIARQLLNGEDLSSDALYNKTAAQLMAALNKGLGGTSFDDEDSRTALQSKFKQNIEQFSYAKTLTQFQLFKDAVFNEKGQIQSLATVKKAVADTGEVFNNNYLRAEHQYVVQTAIMAHKWETMDAQYLEFTTVGDSHVRASHKLFDKFTALKTDPIWKRLYTPLDWGCRCTVIPGVAKNVSKEYDSDWANKVVDPLVKGTIFDNNAALTGKVFTDKHPYFKASPTVLTIVNVPEKDRYSGISFEKVDGIKGKGVLEKFTTGKQNPQEEIKNQKAITILAEKGGYYRMLPVIEDGNKNPDALNLKTKQLVDIKVSETKNGKNIVQSALKEANKQGTNEVVIHLTKKPDSYRAMYLGLRNTLLQNRAKKIKSLTVIFPDNTVKEYNLIQLKNNLNNKRAK